MAWSVPPSSRPSAASVFRRRRSPTSQPWAIRAADPGPGPSPLAVRRYAGCLVIEVVEAIGPAAEPHLGRLLHGAIRPGGAGVLVDLRHAADLGASGLSVLRLARSLADRHGLPFGVVCGDPLPPALPGAGAAAVGPGSGSLVGGEGQSRLPPTAVPSALPSTGG